MKPAILIPIVIGALVLAGCTSGPNTAPLPPPANEKVTPAVNSTGPRSDTIPEGTWQSVRDPGRRE